MRPKLRKPSGRECLSRAPIQPSAGTVTAKFYLEASDLQLQCDFNPQHRRLPARVTCRIKKMYHPFYDTPNPRRHDSFLVRWQLMLEGCPRPSFLMWDTRCFPEEPQGLTRVHL